jgi:3-dehydroquinate dehydratase/shikimate dehydrogenase
LSDERLSQAGENAGGPAEARVPAGLPRATLVATLTAPPGPDFAAAVAGADWLEVRADLAGDLDPEVLARAFPGRLLYTLRSRGEGGGFEGREERRRRRLAFAAERFDLVDLEAARDLAPGLLARVPPAKRLISWHGPGTDLAGLKDCFERMAAVEAALYKLVPAVTQPGDEVAPLQLLAELGRRDVVAFAQGAAGVWTRLLAPRLGAPVVFGAAGERPGAPGQPSLRALRADYGLPDLPPVERLYGIAGNPVVHSLSPRLHNGAYRELGIAALYLPFEADSFGDFWLEVVESGVLEALGMPLTGLSITTPFKEAALAVAGAESPLASRIGAANTLVCNQGVWEAESTDPDGVMLPLAQAAVPVAGRRAVVLGLGGAGRAAAVGLAGAGALVTLASRGVARGEQAAAGLHLPFVPAGELDAAAFDILVNATPLGREAGEPLPFSREALARLRPGSVVIDLTYRDPPAPTALAAAAAAAGVGVIEGREVLLAQALGQFRLMTGRELPAALGRRLLGLPPAPDLAALPPGPPPKAEAER